MTADMQRVIASYADVDERRAELQRHDGQSLVMQSLAAATRGLHSAVNRHDVLPMLRAGIPINGLRRIDYGDGREHWETALLTTLIDGHYDAAHTLISCRAAVDATCFVSVPGRGGFAHTTLHMTVSQENMAATRILVGSGADVNRQTTLGLDSAVHRRVGRRPAHGLIPVAQRGGQNRPRLPGHPPEGCRRPEYEGPAELSPSTRQMLS